MGTGNSVKVPSLNRGRYDLVVSAPGFQPAEVKITVPDKGRTSWKATLKAEGIKGESSIKEVVPLHRNWLFWAGVGGGAAAVTAGSIVTYNALKAEPIPPGDILVTTP